MLQLRVLLQLFDRGFSPALVARCQVDEKWAIVEGRFGVLKGQLADYGEADTLGMSVVFKDGWVS